MIKWYHEDGVALPEDKERRGSYTSITDDEWNKFLAKKKDWQKFVNDPSTNLPVLETDYSILRIMRETECFPVINRGQLWYSHLTDSQLEELKAWYEAWLNVTKSLNIPTKPSWL